MKMSPATLSLFYCPLLPLLLATLSRSEYGNLRMASAGWVPATAVNQCVRSSNTQNYPDLSEEGPELLAGG